MRVVFSASIVWLSMLSIAVVGGAVRDKALAPRLGPQLAGQLETLAVAALFAAGIVAYVRLAGLPPSKAIAVGSAWCAATVGFETFLGCVVLRQPWREVLANYNVAAGRLWPVVLVVILVTPYVAARWQHR